MKRSWIGALLGGLCLVVAPRAFAAEPGQWGNRDDLPIAR